MWVQPYMVYALVSRHLGYLSMYHIFTETIGKQQTAKLQ